MKVKFLCLFFVVVGCFVIKIEHSQSAVPKPNTMKAQIIHAPVAAVSENENFIIEARVDGGGNQPMFMRLYFKSKEADSFDYLEMTKNGSGFFAELKPGQFSAPELHYFLLVLLSDQSVITMPEWNPYGSPLKVAVTPGMATKTPVVTLPPSVPETSQPEFLPDSTTQEWPPVDVQPLDPQPLDTPEDESPLLILSPEPDEILEVGEDVLIAVSFGFSAIQVDALSLNLFIDGVNVSGEAEISDNIMTFTASQLLPGEHHVLVQAYQTNGAAIPAVDWKFQVKGEVKKRTVVTNHFRGLAYAESRQENISAQKFTDNNIGGSFFGEYGKAKFDARVHFTSRESSQFQARNRFTLNVDLPVIGFTLGDTYPRFNDLMLWGKRVRGVHGRIHLGFFNIDVVHGETNRRVGPVFQLNVAGQDSLVSFGTHRQRLLGIRQSFGSGRNFQLGFNLLKVKDDTTSLKTGEYSVPPQDNLVAGSDFLLAFDNHRIELRASAAVSLVTTDISTGTISKAEIEDQFDVELPFDPAEFNKYLIINSSTTPLDPRDLTSLAYNINFRFNYFNNDIQVGFKTIGSEYVSLGNSFLRTNLQGFYFSDRLRLFKNKVYLNLGIENYQDNFDPDDQNLTTRLTTVNSGISFFPGPGLPNLTVNFRNHNRNNGEVDLDIDTSSAVPDTTDNRENNDTRDVSVQLNYDVDFMQLRNSITVSYITSDRNDHFGTSRLDGINLTETSSNVELVSVRTQYRFPLTTTINFARNENKFSGGQNNFKFNLLGARAEYAFFNRKLRTHFATNYTTAAGLTTIDDTTQTITDYKRLAFNIGARFEFASGHFLYLDGHLIRFDDAGGTFTPTTSTLNPSFTDRIFRIYYEKRF